MKKESKNETKLYMEVFVPEAVSDIMATYTEFMKADNVKDLMMKDSEKVKEFIEFHKAVKTALSNIETILKFYKWTEEDGENINDSEDIKNKIKNAEKSIINDLKNNNFK